jgi:hypothetical protein
MEDSLGAEQVAGQISTELNTHRNTLAQTKVHAPPSTGCVTLPDLASLQVESALRSSQGCHEDGRVGFQKAFGNAWHTVSTLSVRDGYFMLDRVPRMANQCPPTSLSRALVPGAPQLLEFSDPTTSSHAHSSC